MSTDDRDILETLRAELAYVEAGGYGRRVKTPHTPTSVFQDSLTCINYGYPYRAHPCNECALIDFVPEGGRGKDIPCHHIPLDAGGATVQALEGSENQEKLEESVKEWLRARIKRIESERAAQRAV